MSRIVVRRAGRPELGGPAYPGESLYAGAVRLLREAGGEHVTADAVDLSGEDAVFTSDPTPLVAVRPMLRADLPDLVRWESAPHVRTWWDDAATDLALAEERRLPAIVGDDPTRMWVLEVSGRSVGYAQTYRIGDHPEWALLTARPEAVGLDYAIGDPAWVGRGIGTRLLWTLLRDVVPRHHAGAREVFAAPDHRNAVSLRVLDKLGFVRGLWFDEPRADGGVITVIGCTLDLERVLGAQVTDG